MRYMMQQPVAWADELNIILLLWVMFIAGALVLRDNEQVAFDIAWNAAPARGRRAMGIIAALAFGGLFVAALPGTWSYITFLWRERTTVLEWRLDIVYSCYLVFFIADSGERSLRARQLTQTDRAGDAIAQWPLPRGQRRRSLARYCAAAGPSPWRGA